MNAYFHAMKHSFDFKGRATRSQFWLFGLVFGIIFAISVGIDLSIGGTSSKSRPIESIIYLIHLIPSLSITVRRLHDIGRTGWWSLIGLVPVIGAIVMLAFACTGSKTENNKFDTDLDSEKTGAEPALGQGITTNSLDEIEKIASLRSSGAISEEEFREFKTGILARGLK